MENKDIVDHLLEQLKEARASGLLKPVGDIGEMGGPLEVGQIRRIDPLEGRRAEDAPDSVLGLVCRVNWDSHSVIVVLVKPSANATIRDVLFAGVLDAGLSWAGMAIVDAVATIHVDQLVNNPVVGRIPKSFVPLLVLLHTFEEERFSHLTSGAAGVETGILSCEPGDDLWVERGEWATQLASLVWLEEKYV